MNTLHTHTNLVMLYNASYINANITCLPNWNLGVSLIKRLFHDFPKNEKAKEQSNVYEYKSFRNSLSCHDVRSNKEVIIYVCGHDYQYERIIITTQVLRSSRTDYKVSPWSTYLSLIYIEYWFLWTTFF